MKVRENFQRYSYGEIADMDDASDIEYWQSKTDEERFDAAWLLVEQACELQGKSKDELRFQRSIASLQRRAS